jgi:ElaB/YqjD/DUF883 family membrane-anchored ribosome-binding protein
MDELFQDSPGVIGESDVGLGERVADRITLAKLSCVRLQKKTRIAARRTDVAIREHPYPSIAIALGAGFLIGALIGRGHQQNG